MVLCLKNKVIRLGCVVVVSMLLRLEQVNPLCKVYTVFTGLTDNGIVLKKIRL
jgi:hypothetical protein